MKNTSQESRQPKRKTAPSSPKSAKGASSVSRTARVPRNQEFSLITYMFLGIFLLMMAYFVYFMVFRSEDVINSPYNRRQDTFGEHVIRGDILSADGETLAETIVAEDGSERRYYPYGAMFAHAVGYDSNGKSGIESFGNFSLLRSHAFFLEQLVNGLQEEKNPGDTIVSTLNYELQKTAYNALGDQNGAVLVMEPRTGKILAMVSKPDFDPNTIERDWDSIISDEDNSVLLNRTTQGLYPPGSTFKIFTMLEYIRENPNYGNYSYQCTGELEEDDYVMHCAGGAVHGWQDLKESFANSCNTSFSNIGLGLDRSSFSSFCNDMLFHTDLPVQYPFYQSRFSLSASTDKPQVMQTAIGQGETMLTPMHLALVTCGIANEGVVMKPYVIEHTENYKGVSVKKYRPSVYTTLMEKEESELLREYMEYVVTSGTGTELMDGAYTAAGKTGTAEYSNDKSQTHSWFTGYAYNEEGDMISVTVIVEGSAYGNGRSLPIVRALFDAYFY